MALVHELGQSFDAIDLDEIDGEFYWRVCRDDLLDPLSQLAASIAPHIVGRARKEHFDDAEQQAIAEFSTFVQMQAQFAIDQGEVDQHRLIDAFKEQLQIHKLRTLGQAFVEQIPTYVWARFSVGRRIPLLPPSHHQFTDDGRAVEIRIYSRQVTGTDLEGLLGDLRGIVELPSNLADDQEAEAFSDVIAPYVTDELDPSASSRIAVHFEFALAQYLKSAALQPALGSQDDAPFVEVTVHRPIPQEGAIGPAYDAIVRDLKKWHTHLRGGASIQEKHVAIRTWGLGLLIANGDRYLDAQRAVETLTNRQAVSASRFNQDRWQLINRIPEARAFLYARAR